MPQRKILLLAPSYGLVDRVLEPLQKMIVTGFPQTFNISMRPPQKIRNKESGSYLECRSAEAPSGILGKGFDLIVVDECSRISRNVYETKVVPASGKKIGEYYYISTPFGKNWFFEKYLKAKEENGGFQYKSIDNPYFTKEKWEEAKRILPEAVFSQEYHAEFLPDAAAVFRGIEEICHDYLNKGLDVEKGHYYVMGVDLGRQESFTAISVIDKTTHEEVHHERFKKIEYPLQKKRIIAIAQRYNHARIIIDSTSISEAIAHDLEREGLMIDEFKFFTSKKASSKKDLIEKAVIFVEQGLVKLANDPIWKDELTAFGYNLTQSGRITYSAPEGLHDDTVIARCLAIYGLSHRKPDPEEAHRRAIRERLRKSHRESPI